MISQLGKVLPLVKDYVRRQHKHVSSEWDLGFHVYGQEKTMTTTPPGIFIVAEAIAETQDLANSLTSKARVAMIVSKSPLYTEEPPLSLVSTACAIPIAEGHCRERWLRHRRSHGDRDWTVRRVLGVPPHGTGA